MNWFNNLWRRSETTTVAHQGEQCNPETTTVEYRGERLFSVFEDGSESVLLQQCQDDFAACGFDSFQSRRKAMRILENARAAALAEAGEDRATTSGVVEEICSDIARSRDGVTPEDSKWYWNLPPLARAVMREFDKELRAAMEINRLPFNICIEDLEEDLRRRLPTFGNDRSADSEDAPLPWELRRRFETFMFAIIKDENKFNMWSDRIRQASSMNALIREEIRTGRL